MKKPKVPPRKSLNTPNYIGSKDFYNNLKKLPGLPLNKPKEDSPLVKKTKAVLAAVSRIPGNIGIQGQALSVGADLGTGIAKSFRGDKQGARKDFAQAAAGAAALFKPLGATKFAKSGNIIIDVSDISEVLPTGDTRQKKKSSGVTVSYSKGGKISKKK